MCNKVIMVIIIHALKRQTSVGFMAAKLLNCDPVISQLENK